MGCLPPPRQPAELAGSWPIEAMRTIWRAKSQPGQPRDQGTRPVRAQVSRAASHAAAGCAQVLAGVGDAVSRFVLPGMLLANLTCVTLRLGLRIERQRSRATSGGRRGVRREGAPSVGKEFKKLPPEPPFWRIRTIPLSSTSKPLRGRPAAARLSTRASAGSSYRRGD